MGDLDQLAAVATVHIQSQKGLAAAKAKRNKTISIIVLSCLGVVAIVVCSVFLRSRGVIASAREFDVTYKHDRDGDISATVMNRSDSDLIIKSATVNGEYSFDTVLFTGGYAKITYPVTLSIGDSYQFSQSIGGAYGYNKTAIYIDFVTNRGTHRYYPGRGWK